MILSPKNITNCLKQVRKIYAKVELYNGSALVNTFSYDDKLIEFTVDRIGENSKFFGFDVCQKVNVKVQDVNKELSITTANSLVIYMAAGDAEYIKPFVTFYVTEVHRDEITNELSITAYDLFYKMQERTVAELALTAPYTIQEFANACAALFGLTVDYKFFDTELSNFAVSYTAGANFDGTETIREALKAVAEATQTIVYISGNSLVFKRLSNTIDISNNNAISLEKAYYINLDTGDNRRLSTITHATELGDNVSVTTGVTGSTQYIRDNPFFDLRDDVDTLLDTALAASGGLTIQELEIEWIGLFTLEIGDIFNCVLGDDLTNWCFLLNDTLTYNGAMVQKTNWSYEDTVETASNPATIGEALKKTYARVDKANKEIDLLVSETTANSDAITNLQLDTNGISASVNNIEASTRDALNDISGNITTLTERVEATMSADEVNLKIETELANGSKKVVTSTGFTFDENGLTVEKTDSEMKTTITEDGMQVFKDDEAVLTANNVGVNARNLHATTYLIIGTNSRFEDYKTNRTGCFWIGE